MAATVLGNVIVPEIFNPYVIQRTADLSALWQAGIVRPVSDINISNGGQLIQMPFWQDLVGDSQILSTDTDLTVSNIEAEKDVAVVNGRALVYGSRDLAASLAGDDPLTAIGDLTAEKWARDMQKTLIYTLNGAMGSLAAESPAVNTLNISGLTGDAAVFSGEAFIDAMGQLGDAETKLTAVCVHSATYRLMKKQNLIEFIPNARGEVVIPTYMGKRVIVDDAAPKSGSVYTSYLFGDGAIGYAEGTPEVPSEVERDAKGGGGGSNLISRRHFVLHPRGIAFTGSYAKDTPTNAELATTNKWTRRYESKNIRIVRFVHKVD